MVRPRSRARAYTGFLPLITGYNGENGLISSITVWEVSSAPGGQCPHYSCVAVRGRAPG